MKLINRKITTLLLSTAAILAFSGCGSEGIPSERGLSGTPVAAPVAEGNTPPVANAGDDQNVSLWSEVTLDGSASSDVDANTLSYSWTLISPQGSMAVLSDANVVNPTFKTDVEGNYTLQLIVNDGTDNSAPDAITVIATYKPSSPKVKDSYEGSTGDNNVSTAGTIEVGATLQPHSIYPQGDYDWVKVELEMGKKYEFFAINLNEVGDTYLYLYDNTDQSAGNHIESDDDYIDYDSHIIYTAAYTGTYYLKVRSYSVVETTSYQLGIREYMDSDADNYTPTYDCNDNNDTIYPYATEIGGDGIDQDCSGVDAIADGTVDLFEMDNDIASAKPTPETLGAYEEIQHRKDIYSQMRTLHDTSDTDFYSISLPAYSSAFFIEDSDDGGNSGAITDYDWYAYDENGTEMSNGNGRIYQILSNNTDTGKTYHVEIRSNGSDIGWYVPALVKIGEDRDGDGFWTSGWSVDCDDANASINPNESDTVGDGIDQNCDGMDGINSDYRS